MVKTSHLDCARRCIEDAAAFSAAVAQAACTALWLLHVLYAVPVRAAVVFGPACWLQREEAELEKLREKERIRSGKELQVLCLLQLLCAQNSWSDPGACSLCSCMCESSAWPCCVSASLKAVDCTFDHQHARVLYQAGAGGSSCSTGQWCVLSGLLL